MTQATIRPAVRGDAAAMAVLIDLAGSGLPAWLWSTAGEHEAGSSILAYGRRRARRDDGAFSYRNALIAECDGEAAGMLLGYRLPDETAASPAGLHPALVPLAELEALAAGTWYINALAVFEEFQGRGIGAALLGEAGRRAAGSAASGLSLIVEDTNTRATGFYERGGYARSAARPYVPFPGGGAASQWLLMVKPAPAGG